MKLVVQITGIVVTSSGTSVSLEIDNSLAKYCRNLAELILCPFSKKIHQIWPVGNFIL